MSGAVRLFVYGSLLSGEENHAYLERSPLLFRGRTAPLYTLVDLGPYPALLEGGAVAVRGEVYGVSPPTLASLDALEGHPTLYRRVSIRLETDESVEGYVLERADLAEGRAVVQCGDWRNRRRPRRDLGRLPAPMNNVTRHPGRGQSR